MVNEADMRKRRIGQTSRKRNPIRRRNMFDGIPDEDDGDDEREVEICVGVNKSDDSNAT